MKTIHILLVFISISTIEAQIPLSDPLFTNSIVSTEIDFIKSTDPDAFSSVTYVGRENKEMPDSRDNNNGLFDSNTFVYEATFSNGKKIGIWCHSWFENESAAKEYVDKLTPRLGKLPQGMRDELSHVVLHKGDAGAFAESEGHFFVLYSDNMNTRIRNNDLEETVFHEAVHASLDQVHLSAPDWLAAQTNDGNFITEYAKSRPNKEDLAETAIFAYTMLRYPGRLNPSIENWVNTYIPNRINYINTAIFSGLLGIDNYQINNSYKELTVYPNPSNALINVILNKAALDTYLELYDLSGRLITSIKATIGTNVIPIHEIEKGVYFLIFDGYRTVEIIKS